MNEIEETVLDSQDEIKKFKVQIKKDLNLYSERLSKIEGKNTKKGGKRAQKKKNSNDDDPDETYN